MQETQEYHYTCIGLFKRLGFLINYLLYLNLEIPKPFMHKNTRKLLYLLQIIFKIRLITDPLSLLSPKYDKSFLLTVNKKKGCSTSKITEQKASTGSRRILATPRT